MLNSDPFSDMMEYLTNTCDLSTRIMKPVIQLTPYYFNCDLSIFQLIGKKISCPIDISHMLFQNLEGLLRAIFIHHYSIPIDYPTCINLLLHDIEKVVELNMQRKDIFYQKHIHHNNVGTGNQYNETLSTSMSSLIQKGEPFELIDGNQLNFSGIELHKLFQSFHVMQTEFIQKYNINNPKKLITEAPLVISIIGLQGSGKSTLLNYLFGCKFLTSTGRCTQGVNGSLLELNKPINKSKFLLVLDTEGINSVERSPAIHFDRTLILFCLSVSNVVIVNLTGELNNEMQELMKMCAYSLNHLKVHRTTMPQLTFVLNQTADSHIENGKTALKLLINNLDKGIDVENKGDKVSDLIQLTQNDIFTLPPEFEFDMASIHIEEIVNKPMTIPSNALNSIFKCLLLRNSIFGKLEISSMGERPSFTNMSEWLDMADETWKTIIKYQDIVRFRNTNEMNVHKKLKVLVDKLVKEYLYTTRKEIYKIAEEYSSEIEKFHSSSVSELMDHINRKILKFEVTFDDLGNRCIREFNKEVKNMQDYLPLLEEHLDHLKKCISMEKLDCIILIKTHTNKVYHHKERFHNFKKTVTNNISKYVTMEIKEQGEAFDKIWEESFHDDDLEKSYREQNLSDFYTRFSRECDLIPYQELSKLYKRNGFKFEAIERALKTNLIENLTKNIPNKEAYFFPTKNSFPLKDIKSHFNFKKLEYLKEESFYNVHSIEGQESNFVQYFPSSKAILKRDWVPEDCVPLLQSCSGYYPEHDINWKELSPRKQIIKLVTSLIRSKMSFSHSIPRFVMDIIYDTAVFNDHEITPVTIQQIVGALEKRLTIFNHEISYIGAELSIHARRSIATFIFSKAFTSYHTRKWKVYSHYRKTIATKKASLKQYFNDKVELSKTIHSNTEWDSSLKYDDDIAQKYVKIFTTTIDAYMVQKLSRKIHEQLRREQESFNYESITLEAKANVNKALSSDALEESDYDFVVRYICQRNDALEEIFDDRWRNFVEKFCRNIMSKIVEDVQTEISQIIVNLENIQECLNIEDKSLLNSKKCFKPCKSQPKDSNDSQLNESPYKSMVLYLKYVMNPENTTETVLNFFGKKFECNNTRMRLISDYLKEDNLLGYFDLGSVFEVLDRAGFFETELIFNLHSFITSFQKYLQESEITISENRLLETISGYKQSMIKDSLGCTRQCPCCGKFCDRINHEETSCFSSGHKETSCFSSGHQFASMGGNTWANDKQHSAILMRCEDYSEEMAVTLPGRMTTWREFKWSTKREWDWRNDYYYYRKSQTEHMIEIWDKFGKGILDYQRVHKGTRIEFRPYEDKDLKSESDITKYQLCFVIDGTSSIGRNIENVRDSIQHLVNSYKRTKKTICRVIIYRDHCDDKLIESYPIGNRFLSSDESIVNFLNNFMPGGGGDVPEASLDGLAVALNSNWDKGANTRRMIIHLFDAAPHGNFPDYTTHNTNSNPDHCCCCSGKCSYDWQKDVWEKMKELEVEYHGINTGGSRWVEFENTMKRELDYLCKGFTKCGKEQVNNAVMQIFINHQCEPEDDDEQNHRSCNC